MKSLLLFFTASLLLGMISCSPQYGKKVAEEQRSIEKIISVPDTDKDDLYIKANSWAVDAFTSAKSVIQFQDKEAGKILGKYVFNYNQGVYTHAVKQTLDISIKDSKVRVIISDPLFKTVSSMGDPVYNDYRPLNTEKGIQKARAEWVALIGSLEDALKEDSDW